MSKRRSRNRELKAEKRSKRRSQILKVKEKKQYIEAKAEELGRGQIKYRQKSKS